MILVVGLGNIGTEYENTRHNAGFMLLDLLFKNDKLSVKLSQISNTKFKGELVKYGSSTLFLKPHTFMNASGLSVKAVKDFYKCERIIVIHDDIDLKLGALRFKKGGSSGGHNGLKSIDELLGNEYERVRIGVGKGENVINYVLGKFKEDEMPVLNSVLETAQNALLELISPDANLAQISSKFSLKA